MMEKQTFFVPDAYASYSVTPKLSFGLGMYVPYGLGTKWKPGWVGSRFALKTNLQVMVLNPVVSYRLPDIGPVKTYIGGGVVIGIKGDATLSREVTDFVGQTGVQTGTVYLDGSQEKTPVGYNLGIILKPSDMISFGFTYRSQLKLKLRGNAVFTNLPVSGFPNGVVGSLNITTPANWAAGS
jgi:long-chain fatty acid transport protein